MNEFTLSESVERLESLFLNIMYMKPEDRLITPSISNLSDIRVDINKIFTEISCTDIFYTLNSDKQFFGVRVSPVMTANDALAILTTDEKVKFTKYQIELDSKLFEVGLTGTEIVAFLIHEISSMVDSYTIIDSVRELIDLYVLSEYDVISIRDSVNYSQLIIYALKDTMYKLSSALFKEDPEELVNNNMIQACELENALLNAQEKIMSSSTLGEARSPKTYILKWMFMIYRDMNHNSRIVKDTLLDAKEFTASKLEKREIDKTIDAVNKINTQAFTEGVKINKVLESKGLYALSELSLFKSLKTSGLRSIEDEYYEYAMRIKNLDTEEDAMYVLRGINTRLGILEDYIYNTAGLSENEKNHWMEVATKYRQLRDVLSKKKIWKSKNYGLFMDYDMLDQLDKKNSDEL